MLFLIAVVTGDLGRILATETSSTGGARRVDTGDGVESSFHLTQHFYNASSSSSLSESPYPRSRPSWTTRNMDRRSVGHLY